MKYFRLLADTFDDDESDGKPVQAIASTRKSWPNCAASDRKLPTCDNLRSR